VVQLGPVNSLIRSHPWCVASGVISQYFDSNDEARGSDFAGIDPAELTTADVSD
jgi:hypothetical protein